MERVEEVLKQGLDKNLKPITSKSYKVEEVLKRELDTKPITSISHISGLTDEEAFKFYNLVKVMQTSLSRKV